VHAYHVVPVAVLFLCAVASEAIQQARPDWRTAGRRALLAIALFAVSLEATAAVLGFSVGVGVPEAVEQLGHWSMNVLAPVLPQASTLSGHHYANGGFSHTVDPTGGQAVEGFNYLGAGGLVLLAVGAGYAGRRMFGPRQMPDAAFWRRWGPLIAGLVLLTLAAIGPRPYVYLWHGPEIPIPGGLLGKLAGEFRSHGRFFWTVSYAILAGGLLVLDRSSDRHRRLAGGVLAAALALQAVDVSGLALAVKRDYAQPAPRAYPALLDAPGLDGRSWRIFPNYFRIEDQRDKNAVRQLSIRIVRDGGMMNTSATVRAPIEAFEGSTPADALIDAAANDQRLTLVLGGPEITGPFRRRTDCRALERGLLCGQGVRALADVHGNSLF